MTTDLTLSAASIKLLRLIAKHDLGAGVDFRYASRGRYFLRSQPGGDRFNRGTFYTLSDAKFIYDGGSDDTPVHITDAGRAHLAHLDATAKPKTTRAKPTVDSPAAVRLLKAISELEAPTLVYKEQRRIWRLGKGSPTTASVDTWMALARADLIRLSGADAGGTRVGITALGQQRLT